jgi:gliding motility-associated peptidyl-prolyl isomerase
MRSSIILLLIAFLFSCSSPKARKPISHGSGFDQSASIAFNKKLYQSESQVIKNYIAQDSMHHYINSQYGFWYKYVHEIADDTIFPSKGNKVSFLYNVSDFNGNIIYDTETLGRQTYVVEEQEMIQGIQEGIKNMNQGEKVIFLFPSHKAYAYHGDENKIGPNTPIIVKLELLNIH